jgi:hypothetical protein
MTRRKDFEIEITYEKAEKLYNDLLKWSGNEFAGLMFEGSLLDEYAVVMTGNQNWKINLSKGRPVLARKYVFIKEEYVNCWSSKNVLVLTDNKKEFENFLRSRFINESNFEDFCCESGLNDEK